MKKAAIVLSGLLLGAVNGFAGWYFESSTIVSGGRAEQAAMMNTKTKNKMSGNSLRSDIAEGQNPMMPAGSYMISTDGGKTMNLVSPATKSYSVMDLQAMAGMFSGGMMKIVNPKFEKISDEDGGKLLGHAVRHVKYQMSYTMEMNFMGMKNSSAVDSTREIWTAPGILEDGSTFWSGQQGFATGDKAFDRQILDEMAKIKGLPLKQVITSRNTDATGKTTETVMTMTVSTIREEKVAASEFEIPADYQQTPMLAGAIGAAAQGTKGGPGAKPGTGFDPAAMQDLLKKLKTPEH